MKKTILITMFLSIGRIILAQVIAAGDEFSISICSDSTVKSWGDNNLGELGIGYASTTGCFCDSVPSGVLGLTGITSVAGGVDFGIALKEDGTVWSWGWGSVGATSSTIDRYTPFQVNGISNVIKIAAGGYHSLAIKSDGTLWTWGRNDKGQLGNGTATPLTTPCWCDSVPTQVAGLTNIIDIAGGYTFSLALKSDGTVWSWGQNVNGNLGDSTNVNKYSPVKVNRISGITAIAAGNSHSLALAGNGTVWAWGDNWHKGLGDGTDTSRNYPVISLGIGGVTDISGGANFSLALKNDGTVWFWGYNYSGQGGNGIVDSAFYSCQCVSAPTQVSNLSGIIAISAASEGAHSLALKNDGSIWAWGDNRSGQLGNGMINWLGLPSFPPTDLPCGCDSIPVQVLTICSALMGVNENTETEFNVTIFPNPFTSQTTITFSEEQKNTTIKITDILGKEIKTINFTGRQLVLDKGEMKAGIYFVQTTDEKKRISNNKIIIQ